VQLVGLSLSWLADQNQPLTCLGKNLGSSHPPKSQSLPEVQIYLTPEKKGEFMTQTALTAGEKKGNFLPEV